MHSAPSSLYIHIPFCRSKCSYCDFFSVPESGALPDDYISALCNNIAFRCRQFSVSKLDTVYIGGGTPSLLSQKQLKRILETVRKTAQLSADAEITMEANPADISSELLAFLDREGITRLSVGIQSVDQHVLSALDRRSDAECVEKVLNLLETEWLSRGQKHSKTDCLEKKNTCSIIDAPVHLHRLSLDLIAGLPGLSDSAFKKGIERVISTGADHISLYALMLEEGTRLEKEVSEGAVSYSDEANDRQWIMGRDILSAAGYAQYEVSNFARPGFESRHNTVYWHMQNYLGTGAGGAGTVGNYRWNETTDICAYIHFWNSSDSENESASGGGASCHAPAPNPQYRRVRYQSAAARYEDPPADIEYLDEKTREFEFLMMGFRLLEGVSACEYERRFGKKLVGRIGACEGGLFEDWQKRGLARTYCIEGGNTRYALTPEGILLLNQFLEALL